MNQLRTRKGLVAAIAASIVLVVCACIVLALALGGTPANPTSPPNSGHGAATATTLPTNTPKAMAWVTVQHFTGNQNTQTSTFDLPDGARIVWSVKPSDQYGGNFAATLYDGDGNYMDLVANTTTPPGQSGTYTIHGGSGQAYLNIQDDAGPYDIAVQVYKSVG